MSTLRDRDSPTVTRCRRRRHRSITIVDRASTDRFLKQRFARHVSPLTTTIYTHPGDEEMARRLRRLACQYPGRSAEKGQRPPAI
jgi:hypothetical protein